MVKCGDYFQAEDGPREFGNISVIGKWVNSTETSLVLRLLEVNHREVRLFSSCNGCDVQALYLSLETVMCNSL